MKETTMKETLVQGVTRYTDAQDIVKMLIEQPLHGDAPRIGDKHYSVRADTCTARAVIGIMNKERVHYSAIHRDAAGVVIISLPYGTPEVEAARVAALFSN